MGKLEYNGRPDLERQRKLSEIERLNTVDSTESKKPPVGNDRTDATDTLFRDLAKTYIKGNKLKTALSNMEPTQFIPIEAGADTTRASAIRLDNAQSRNGEIITYSMYQNAVDATLAKKWEIRGTYLKMNIPASVQEESKSVVKNMSNSDKTGGIIEEFLSESGIAGTLLSMLTLAPFQSLIFQSLSVEEGAKTTQAVQVPVGIALFLELGVKAERLLALFQQSGISTPLVELEIANQESNPEARAAALATVGIDYNDFKQSQQIQDAENIIQYVSDYYARYGGLDKPNGHLTLDHWIGYLHVAQNQQTIRGALNIAPTFSPEFKSYQQQYTPLTEQPQSLFNDNKECNISVQLASATRSLKESSNGIYDDILQAFTHQLTDKDMCCLVQIFGAYEDTNLLYTIASVLRVLAVSFAGDIVRLDNIIRRLLANLFQDAMFEIVGQLNEVQYKVLNKITKAFTVNFEGIEACGGLFTLGWALLESVQVIFIQMESILKDVISAISEFGLSEASGSWKVSADRRHLLGMARILEVLASRLEVASVCDKSNNVQGNSGNVTSGIGKDTDQAIFSILESTPPTIQLSDADIQKHFSDLTPFVSAKLKYTYGIGNQQNSENSSTDCGDASSKARTLSLVENLTKAIRETFNG